MKQEIKPLADQVQDQIQLNLTNQPHPTTCTITKIYDDGYCDVKTDEYGVLQYNQTYGYGYNVGDNAILIFLNNNYSERIVITNITIPTEQEEEEEEQ